MTEPTSDAVPDDGTADGTADDEARPLRVRILHGVQMDDQPGPTAARAAAYSRGELGPAGQPGGGR